MVWLTTKQSEEIRSRVIQAAPKALLILVVLITGFISGYAFKGDEVTRDCKYAQAFRVGVDSFACVRKV